MLADPDLDTVPVIIQNGTFWILKGSPVAQVTFQKSTQNWLRKTNLSLILFKNV